MLRKHSVQPVQQLGDVRGLVERGVDQRDYGASALDSRSVETIPGHECSHYLSSATRRPYGTILRTSIALLMPPGPKALTSFEWSTSALSVGMLLSFCTCLLYTSPSPRD